MECNNARNKTLLQEFRDYNQDFMRLSKMIVIRHSLPVSGIINPMLSRLLFYFKGLFCLGILVLILAGCTRGPAPSATPGATAQETPAPTKQPTDTPTPLPPSPSPEPLAALVNEKGITIADYQAELAVYRAAIGADLTPEDEKRVLDDLIDQMLFVESAAEKGFVVDEKMLQERLQALQDQMGGEAALSGWITSQGYTAETFRRALARQIAVAWMRDQIIAATPTTAEQIHARQILLYNSQEANDIYAQLQAGNDFGNLAAKYDPVTGGDLDWFPRGYLPDAKLEEIAFSLQPNQYSAVIQTKAGFHILQVLERDAQRPLDPGPLLVIQAQAVQAWLDARRSASDIQILV
jgi:peptidyl-prolyl cis-trans isomerase C